MSFERQSISSMHVFWESGRPPQIAAGWYIETRNASNETIADSRHAGWNGPAPGRYRATDVEQLRTDLQAWEPEARVIMHLDTLPSA